MAQSDLKDEKKTRGGARKGAGMPKGYKTKKTLAKEVAREVARKIITADLMPMLEAQIAKAKGIRYLVTRDKSTGKFIPVSAKLLKTLDPKDVLEVWEKTPDTAAFNSLMDRALDRPKEQEQDLNVDAEMTIKWES
jgi:hypothetical protein